MQRKFASIVVTLPTVLATVLALAISAWAAKREVLYSFKGGDDGKYPTYPGLVFDKSGNAYGMTFDGGKYGLGTVFELKPSKDGSWAETVIHAFAGSRDGAEPYSGLVMDSAGNLYGTTLFGGGLGTCTNGGCGTVFRLSRGQNGRWKETILRRFDLGSRGGEPTVNLTLDSSGNLYDVAEGGDGCQQHNCGVVFELVHGSGAPWEEKVLYAFHNGDGGDPSGPLMFDVAGKSVRSDDRGGPRRGGCIRVGTPPSVGRGKRRFYSHLRKWRKDFVRAGRWPSISKAISMGQPKMGASIPATVRVAGSFTSLRTALGRKASFSISTATRAGTSRGSPTLRRG